jgi:hypothetical protein
VLAVRRYEAAVTAERAPDVHIALFEAFAWFDNLDERTKLSGTGDLRAMRFVRQRTHHQYAAATYPDKAIGGWRWYNLAVLPLGDPSPRHRKQNEIGERLYQRKLVFFCTACAEREFEAG